MLQVWGDWLGSDESQYLDFLYGVFKKTSFAPSPVQYPIFKINNVTQLFVFQL